MIDISTGEMREDIIVLESVPLKGQCDVVDIILQCWMYSYSGTPTQSLTCCLSCPQLLQVTIKKLGYSVNIILQTQSISPSPSPSHSSVFLTLASFISTRSVKVQTNYFQRFLLSTLSFVLLALIFLFRKDTTPLWQILRKL